MNKFAFFSVFLEVNPGGNQQEIFKIIAEKLAKAKA